MTHEMRLVSTVDFPREIAPTNHRYGFQLYGPVADQAMRETNTRIGSSPTTDYVGSEWILRSGVLGVCLFKPEEITHPEVDEYSGKVWVPQRNVSRWWVRLGTAKTHTFIWNRPMSHEWPTDVFIEKIINGEIPAYWIPEAGAMDEVFGEGWKKFCKLADFELIENDPEVILAECQKYL